MESKKKRKHNRKLFQINSVTNHYENDIVRVVHVFHWTPFTSRVGGCVVSYLIKFSQILFCPDTSKVQHPCVRKTLSSANLNGFLQFVAQKKNYFTQGHWVTSKKIDMILISSNEPKEICGYIHKSTFSYMIFLCHTKFKLLHYIIKDVNEKSSKCLHCV